MRQTQRQREDGVLPLRASKQGPEVASGTRKKDGGAGETAARRVAGDLRGHGAEHEAGCGRELSSAVRGTLMAPGSVDTDQEAALSPRGAGRAEGGGGNR